LTEEVEAFLAGYFLLIGLGFLLLDGFHLHTKNRVGMDDGRRRR